VVLAEFHHLSRVTDGLAEFFSTSQILRNLAICKISSTASQVTPQAESIEMVQYNPHDEDDNIADMHGLHRDEVGLIRVICVKVHGTNGLIMHTEISLLFRHVHPLNKNSF